MAKLSELVRGFRANVRNGIPSTLMYRGESVYLTSERKEGFVGICNRTTTAKPPKGKDDER